MVKDIKVLLNKRSILSADSSRRGSDPVRVWDLSVPMPEAMPGCQAHEDRSREEQTVSLHSMSKSFLR